MALLAGPLSGIAAAQVEAGARGPWRDLAGQWIKGDAVYGLDACYAGPEPVRTLELDQDGEVFWTENILSARLAGSSRAMSPLDWDVCDSGSEPTGVDSTTVPEGVHTYRTLSYGTEGGIGYSDPWEVSIDRTPPAIQLAGALWDTPSQGGSIGADPVAVGIDATDGSAAAPQSGVASIQAFLTPPGGTEASVHLATNTCTAASNCAQSTTYTLDPGSYAADGTYAIRVVAIDKVGNAAQSAWAVVIDRSAPAFRSDFTITGALDSATGKAIIDWDAAENASIEDGPDGPGPVAGYRYRYRHVGGVFSAWIDSPGGLERAEIPGAALNDAYELQIVAIDASGNESAIKGVTVVIDRLGHHCQATANGVPTDCANTDVEFGPDAEELEPEDGEPTDGVQLATEPPSFAAGAHRRVIKVTPPGEWTTIRRDANSFVIGQANGSADHHWTMDVLDDQIFGEWAVGTVNGEFGDCGWVKSFRIPSSSSDPSAGTDCPDDFLPELDDFASGVNCQDDIQHEDPNGNPKPIYSCDAATSIRLLRSAKSAKFCLNVDPPPVNNIPLRCRDVVNGRLTPAKIDPPSGPGYRVGWRYVTDGGPGHRGRFVLVADPHVDNSRFGRWGFIARSAFPARLCARGADQKYACGDPIEGNQP